jgi:hypothetical protein
LNFRISDPEVTVRTLGSVCFIGRIDSGLTRLLEKKEPKARNVGLMPLTCEVQIKTRRLWKREGREER